MTKIVNSYILYELNAWPKNLMNNFKLKNCLFGATSIVINNVKENWCIVYSVVWYNGVILQIHGILVMTLLEML